MGTDDLNLGMDGADTSSNEHRVPPALSEANAFMDEREEVHGVGLGATEDGEDCIVIFADRIPSDAVPTTLDGLPVRVQDSDSFFAEAHDAEAGASDAEGAQPEGD